MSRISYANQTSGVSMTTRHTSLPINIENWPISPPQISSSTIECSRRIESTTTNSTCLLGNPETADHVFNWLYDSQESVFSRISLYRNKEDDCLRTSICLDLDLDTPQQKELWKLDLGTVIDLHDSVQNWTTNNPPHNTWNFTYILEVKGYISNQRPATRQLHRLLEILERRREPIAIQTLFSLQWKLPRHLKKERIPDEYNHHFQAREYWRQHQKCRLALATMSRRIIERRVIVSTMIPLSSLLKHNIFRGLIGGNLVTATWRPLSQKDRSLTHLSPRRAMSLAMPFAEQIPATEMHSMLTANLAKAKAPMGYRQLFQDDIPF